MATFQQSNPDLAESLDRVDSTRVCSACGITVARQDCHKNRYAEYICHQCQRAGILFTRRAQLRDFFTWSTARFLGFLTAVGLVLLVAWALYRFLK